MHLGVEITLFVVRRVGIVARRPRGASVHDGSGGKYGARRHAASVEGVGQILAVVLAICVHDAQELLPYRQVRVALSRVHQLHA